MHPDKKPVPKVAAVGGAGVVVTAIVALLAAFDIIIPEEITQQAVILVTAIVSIVTFVAGYLKPAGGAR